MYEYPALGLQSSKKDFFRIYEGCKKAALDLYIAECLQDEIWHSNGHIFIGVSHMGTDGRLWGSGKSILPESLVGRDYTISFPNTGPSGMEIHFNDELYNPITRKLERCSIN